MRNRIQYTGVAVLFPMMLVVLLPAQNPPVITQLDKKKNEALNLPKDPPLVAVGDTSRLTFQVSPLSGQGLFSQQVRDALKAILKLNGGVPIIHIRAFSAGSGDLRRVPQIVSDVLGDKHGPLPSVSVLQTGGLTMEDAQIVLEAVSEGKKEINKDGLTFHSAETVVATEPTMPVKGLLQKAIEQLVAKMNGSAALSVTCFVSDLEGAKELQGMVTSGFPGAATTLVQPRRLAWQTEASCEGVSRGGGNNTSRTAFTGTQVAFGTEEKDAAVAIQRLDRALSDAGAARTGNAALLRFYLLSPATAAVVLKQMAGSAPFALFSVEGVGPVSAGFAMDAVAPVR